MQRTCCRYIQNQSHKIIHVHLLNYHTYHQSLTRCICNPLRQVGIYDTELVPSFEPKYSQISVLPFTTPPRSFSSEYWTSTHILAHFYSELIFYLICNCTIFKGLISPRITLLNSFDIHINYRRINENTKEIYIYSLSGIFSPWSNEWGMNINNLPKLGQCQDCPKMK